MCISFMNNGTEDDEQIAFVEYLQWMKIPHFHIANGGFRNAREAARLKRAGVCAGVPDLFLPVPSGGRHGLFIEMKRVKGGIVSPNQKIWLRDLDLWGYGAQVTAGCERAIEALESYLK